jgi:hypothetical protein
MSQPIKALVIQPDGRIEHTTLSSYDDYNKAVGGWIEALQLGPNASGYINEEGKLIGLPRNDKATKLCHARKSIFPTDFIVGPLLVVGPLDSEGNDTDLSDEVAKVITFLCS